MECTEYDVVIAGCGMAGAVAGLVALKDNLRVCIVEKKKKEFIGKKMCGELMPRKMLTLLENEVDISFKGYPLKGLEVCSAHGHRAHVPELLCTIDRWQIGQVLTEELVRRGAEVVQGTVTGPIIESRVKGVKTKDSRKFLSAVTIDCSGVSSVLRRKVFSEPEFLGLTYKENLLLKEPVTFEYARLIFDMGMIPSGYAWCFPKNEYELNVGVGGLAHCQTSLKEKFEKVVKTLGVQVERREHPGFGVLPLGRPLPSAVYPGLLVCGDAAHQVNPLTGEGIAPAVTAGVYAGKTAVEAVENNDVSVERLWKYNCDFAREYGIKHAPLVVARDFLISLSDEELDYFLKNVVTGDDLGQLIKGRVTVEGMRKVKTFFKNWRKVRLLYRLYSVFRMMKEIKGLYRHYPQDPEGLHSWQQLLDSYVGKKV